MSRQTLLLIAAVAVASFFFDWLMESLGWDGWSYFAAAAVLGAVIGLAGRPLYERVARRKDGADSR